MPHTQPEDDVPVLIVGASLGALRTAEALRRSGYVGPLTVIGDEAHLPYNRPPLSKAALSDGVSHDDLAFPLRSVIDDVRWMLGTRIVSADLDARIIRDSNGHEHPYRALVAATGVRARRLNFPEAANNACFAVRTLDDAHALRASLQPGSRVVIIGAGFIGCEIAATARTLGCEVTVISSHPVPLARPLGSELGGEIMRRHQAHGVQFLVGRTVTQVAAGAENMNMVTLDDGSSLECDVLIEAVGSHPNTEWLRDNDLNLESGVLTDSQLRAVRADGTPWPDVFAVGDIARFPNALYDNEAHAVEHWNIPSETGKRVGETLSHYLAGPAAVAEPAERFAPVPSFWSDQFEIHLLAYGTLVRADRNELLHGELGDDCIFGYFQGDRLVGVCGIGMRATVMKYRAELAATGQRV